MALQGRRHRSVGCHPQALPAPCRCRPDHNLQPRARISNREEARLEHGCISHAPAALTCSVRASWKATTETTVNAKPKNLASSRSTSLDTYRYICTAPTHSQPISRVVRRLGLKVRCEKTLPRNR